MASIRNKVNHRARRLQIEHLEERRVLSGERATEIVDLLDSDVSANEQAVNSIGPLVRASDEFGSVVPLAALAVPTGLNPQANGAQSVVINWNNVSGATHYKLERATSSGGPWTQIYFSAASQYTDAGAHLNPNTTYFYRVRAGNTGGESAFTAPASTTTFPAAPAVPTGLNPQANGAQSVFVDWNAVISIGDYFLERSTSPSGPFSQIAIRSPSQSNYIDSGPHLSASTTYFYRVRSKVTGIFSDYSAVAEAKTFAEPTEFDPGPRIISPASGSFGTLTAPVSYIDVTFSEPIDPTSFTPADISLRRGTAIIPVQQPTHQGDNVWRIPFAAQTVPGIYTLIVGPNIADLAGNLMNQNANTAGSFVSAFRIAPIPPPGTPQGLTAQLTGNSAVALDWNDVAGADSYALYRSTSPTGPWELQRPLYQGSQSQHHDVGSFLTPGQKYHYAVRASNSGGYSALSSFVSVTIPLSAPLGLDRWWATAGDGELSVTWTVEVPEAGEWYSLNVFGGWGLFGSRVVVLTEPGMPTANFNIDKGYFDADLPELSAGVHQFRIDAFHVPDSVGLWPMKLSLTTWADQVATMTTTLIADHSPDIGGASPRGEYPVGDGKRSFSPEDLVRHFAPILHFDNGEGSGSGGERYAVPFPVERSLGADLTREFGLGSNMEALDLTTWDSGSFTPENSPAAIYASLLYDVSHQELAINYYFHYPLSNWKQHGGFNIHQGDWEGVTIFLGREGRAWVPRRVSLAQHVDFVGVGGVETIEWSDLSIDRDHGGERVDLYVGLGGHATYAYSDITPWPPLWQDEYHRGNGATYVPSPSEVVYLHRLDSPDAFDWVRFPGKWGLTGDSPRGPAFQGLDYVIDASGLRWLDPWEWADRWYLPPEPAPLSSTVKGSFSDPRNWATDADRQLATQAALALTAVDEIIELSPRQQQRLSAGPEEKGVETRSREERSMVMTPIRPEIASAAERALIAISDDEPWELADAQADDLIVTLDRVTRTRAR